jgi:hypothetical protein
VQIGAQTATGLHIQTLVDGFVAHLHQLVIGMIAGQHLGNESGAPPVIHPRFNRRAQPMIAEFEGLGTAGLSGREHISHQGVIVAVGKTIAVILAPDHRAVTPDPVADLGETQTPVAATHDLHAFLETDPMPAPAEPSEISRACQPAQTVLAVA